MQRIFPSRRHSACTTISPNRHMAWLQRPMFRPCCITAVPPVVRMIAGETEFSTGVAWNKNEGPDGISAPFTMSRTCTEAATSTAGVRQ